MIKYIVLISSFIPLLFLACGPSDRNLTNNDQGAKAEKVVYKDGLNPRITDYIKDKNYDAYEVATFAGGCFWCTEAAFEIIDGVVDVISGYSGGKSEHPTYKQIGTGRSGHAEAIQIYYDPTVISFEILLDIFFVAHNPTQLNFQGPDHGTQYRSAVFYHNDTQKQLTEAAIKKGNDSGKFGDPIVTEVTKYDEFWVAEAYHQDYYPNNPQNPYVQSVSRPKVEKVKKYFNDRLKKIR